jgi:hypothetical protein
MNPWPSTGWKVAIVVDLARVPIAQHLLASYLQSNGCQNVHVNIVQVRGAHAAVVAVGY